MSGDDYDAGDRDVAAGDTGFGAIRRGSAAGDVTGVDDGNGRTFDGDSDERSYGADGGGAAAGLGIGEADEDRY